MKLLTKAIRDRLVKNHFKNKQHSEKDGETIDLKPVVKFFNPAGAATWLITEMDPETQMMFGLCDLGMGCPELGYVSFDELVAVKTTYGLGVERDLYFNAEYTLSEYTKKAMTTCRIVA